MGFKGDAGFKGFKGRQGELGLDGDSGDAGESGLSGLDGVPGVNGLKGNMGASGRNGTKGHAGIKGHSGSGVKGNTGVGGSGGLVGAPGPVGLTGDVGYGGACIQTAEYTTWVQDLLRWITQWNQFVGGGGLLPCQNWTEAVSEIEVFLGDMIVWFNQLIDTQRAQYVIEFRTVAAEFAAMCNASMYEAQCQRDAISAQFNDIQRQLDARLP